MFGSQQPGNWVFGATFSIFATNKKAIRMRSYCDRPIIAGVLRESCFALVCDQWHARLEAWAKHYIYERLLDKHGWLFALANYGIIWNEWCAVFAHTKQWLVRSQFWAYSARPNEKCRQFHLPIYRVHIERSWPDPLKTSNAAPASC